MSVAASLIRRMVLFFTSVAETDAGREEYKIYMGNDKHENELLIEHGWPEDWWFHADKHSSAHVYLRLRAGQTIDQVPEQVIKDCAMLTKENSISGKKLKSIRIVYTPWSNLKKRAGMEVGQVGFHAESERRYVKVGRDKPILNRLNKTKVLRNDVDFAGK